MGTSSLCTIALHHCQGVVTCVLIPVRAGLLAEIAVLDADHEVAHAALRLHGRLIDGQLGLAIQVEMPRAADAEDLGGIGAVSALENQPPPGKEKIQNHADQHHRTDQKRDAEERARRNATSAATFISARGTFAPHSGQL